MSKRKKFKRGNGQFVQMHEWVMASTAWATMKPAPRALYIEFKRQYNGSNNGRLLLSHRDASKALNVGRDTVGTYFSELVERGFLRVTRGHCLGPEGIGQSTVYALTEEMENGQPATKEFMKWQKQKPRRKSQHSLAGKSSHPCRKIQPFDVQKTENPTANGKKPNVSVSENPAIYTSNHIPSKDLACANIFQLADYCEPLAPRAQPDLRDTSMDDKIPTPT